MKTKAKKAPKLITGIIAVLMVAAFMPLITQQANAETSEFYIPMTVESGFNIDGVQEDSSTADATKLDSSGYSFYAQDGTEGSLPPGGLIQTTTGKYFKLADYKGKNVLKLDTKDATQMTFDAGSQDKYKKISFLATGGNGGGTVQVTVKFAGQSATCVRDFEVPDWCVEENNAEMAVYKCGRVHLSSNTFEKDPIFGLFDCSIDIPQEYQGYAIESLELQATSFSGDGSTVCIFAVSGVSATGKQAVILDGNGGSAEPAVISASDGTDVELPAATRKGYIFKGWYNGDSFIGMGGSSFTVLGNMILTAHWEELPTVRLYTYGDYWGSTIEHVDENGILSDVPPIGSEIDRGYVVKGYYADYDNATNKYINKLDITKPIPEELLGKTIYIYAEKEKTSIYVQGKRVTLKNCNDVLKDGGKVKYDFKTKVLTLNNAKITGKIVGSVYYGIYAKEEALSINLVGSNKITCNCDEDTAAFGIYAAEGLSMQGTGSVDISVKGSNDCDYTCGIENLGDRLRLSADTKITISGSSEYADGIYSEGSKLTVRNAANLTITNNNQVNEDSDIDKTGIYLDDSYSDIEVLGQSKVSVNAPSGDCGIYNIYALTVRGTSSMTVQGGEVGINEAEEVWIELGSKLQVSGTGCAIYNVGLPDETKKLGIKIKENKSDTYTLWEGVDTEELYSPGIKYVLIPGKTIDFTKVNRVPATCEKEGNYEYWIVKENGETKYYYGGILSEYNLISDFPASIIMPKWGGKDVWVAKVTKKATATAAGKIKYTCKNCGAVKYKAIAKKALIVKAKTAKIKASTLKNKAMTVKKSKALTIKNVKGKLTYSKVSVTKAKYAKKFTVNKKTGNIKVAKGLKKGTYRVKIKVTDAGNKYYAKRTKTATVKIVVY